MGEVEAYLICFVIAMICFGIAALLEGHMKSNAEKERKITGESEIAYKLRKEREIQEFKERRATTCPRCGSKNVVATTRGYSVITGFIGSGNVRIACLACGHKWKPIK